ncbi:MAG: metallophosphoesterase [Candidatus Eisenbacteria sp.]|nr:metallophosphoesterase [Candidatus Eisenbacteria bacterium]
MNIFAIGDLHLSLRGGKLQKPMDIFGDHWRDHHERIATDWRARVGEEDLVLMPGDLSWARDLDEAHEDLEWVHALPGRKILIRGNHDWWIAGSRAKLREAVPRSIHLVLGDCLGIDDVLLFGTRYWQDLSLEFPGQEDIEIAPPQDSARILEREIQRLRSTIEKAEDATRERSFRLRICMLHFPPTDFRATRTRATEMLNEFGIDGCVFGHVHNLPDAPESVEVDGIPYWPVSCDLLGFRLRQIEI